MSNLLSTSTSTCPHPAAAPLRATTSSSSSSSNFTMISVATGSSNNNRLRAVRPHKLLSLVTAAIVPLPLGCLLQLQHLQYAQHPHYKRLHRTAQTLIPQSLVPIVILPLPLPGMGTERLVLGTTKKIMVVNIQVKPPPMPLLSPSMMMVGTSKLRSLLLMTCR